MVSQSEAARMLNVTHVTPRALCARQDGHGLMRFTSDRSYTDPDKAARKLVEIANSVEAVQEGRIFIELINGSFLYEHKASPAEYEAGLNLAIARGWLWLHESGTYVKFTQSGAEMFA